MHEKWMRVVWPLINSNMRGRIYCAVDDLVTLRHNDGSLRCYHIDELALCGAG